MEKYIEKLTKRKNIKTKNPAYINLIKYYYLTGENKKLFEVIDSVQDYEELNSSDYPMFNVLYSTKKGKVLLEKIVNRSIELIELENKTKDTPGKNRIENSLLFNIIQEDYEATSLKTNFKQLITDYVISKKSAQEFCKNRNLVHDTLPLLLTWIEANKHHRFDEINNKLRVLKNAYQIVLTSNKVNYSAVSTNVSKIIGANWRSIIIEKNSAEELLEKKLKDFNNTLMNLSQNLEREEEESEIIKYNKIEKAKINVDFFLETEMTKIAFCKKNNIDPIELNAQIKIVCDVNKNYLKIIQERANRHKQKYYHSIATYFQKIADEEISFKEMANSTKRDSRSLGEKLNYLMKYNPKLCIEARKKLRAEILSGNLLPEEYLSLFTTKNDYRQSKTSTVVDKAGYEIGELITITRSDLQQVQESKNQLVQKTLTTQCNIKQQKLKEYGLKLPTYKAKIPGLHKNDYNVTIETKGMKFKITSLNIKAALNYLEDNKRFVCDTTIYNTAYQLAEKNKNEKVLTKKG